MKPAALCGSSPLPLWAGAGETAPPLRRGAPHDALTAPPRDKQGDRICGECGASLTGKPSHRRAMFCSRACQTVFGNRMVVRGRVLAPLAMVDHLTRHGMRGPREKRGAAKDACRQLRQLIDEYTAEDRAAGRMTALDYIHRRYQLGHAER